MNTEHEIQNSNRTGMDFRSLLQEELLKRCRKNPGYSLRAFARSLKVEPSALSQMISGKRPITEKMKLRLGAALGLKVHELAKLCADSDSAASSLKHEYKKIELDTFAYISDWYHFAILELTYIKGFNSDPAWMSKCLGITKSECNIAIERLLRLGLLERHGEDLVDASESGKLTSLSPSLSSGAARSYQTQLLELSKNSIQSDPLEIRNHTSATFCFDTADLPRAMESITAFRRQFAQEFQPKEQGNEVYQIQISFFPITKNKETL